MHAGVKPRAAAYPSDLSKASGLYSLLALLLLVALTLVALPVEAQDDRWLRTGSIMMAVGLAAWLPFRALSPAALLIWLAPFLTRELLGEARNVSWQDAGEFFGLMFVALGSRYGYLTARGLAQDATAAAENVPLRADLPHQADLPDHPRSGMLSSVAPSVSPDLRRGTWFPGQPRLSEADAAALRREIHSLDIELLQTADLLRSAH